MCYCHGWTHDYLTSTRRGVTGQGHPNQGHTFLWAYVSSPSSDPREDTDEEALDQSEHLSILHENLERFTNRGLLERMGLHETGFRHPGTQGWDDEVHMSMRFALLSHGSDNGLDGPIHNYANFGACAAFQLSRNALLNVPACRVAPPGMDQQIWSMVLQRLQEDSENVLEEYQGYRSTLTDGRRFFIRDAVVRMIRWTGEQSLCWRSVPDLT